MGYALPGEFVGLGAHHDVDPYRGEVNGAAVDGGMRVKVADASAMLTMLGHSPRSWSGVIAIVAEEDDEGVIASPECQAACGWCRTGLGFLPSTRFGRRAIRRRLLSRLSFVAGEEPDRITWPVWRTCATWSVRDWTSAARPAWVAVR